MIAAGFAGVTLATSAHALEWGNGGAGGSGTWNAGNVNWYNGSTDVIWDGTSAIFDGTAGTVTVSGGVSANSLTFDTAGYTIDSSTLTLTGTPVVTANEAAAINSALVLNGGGDAVNSFRGDSTLTIGGATTVDAATGTNRYLSIISPLVDFAGGLSVLNASTASGRGLFFGGVGNANFNGITGGGVSTTLNLNSFLAGTMTISGASDIGGTTANNFIRSGAGNTVLITGTKTDAKRMNFSPLTGGRIVVDLAADDNRWGTQASATDVAARGGTVEVLGSNSVARTQILGGVTTSNRGSSTVLVNPNGGPGTTIFLGGTNWNAGTVGSLLLDVSATGAAANVRVGSAANLLGAAAGGQTATSGVAQYILIKDSTGIGYATHGGANTPIVRYTGADALTATSTGAGTNYKIESASVTVDGATTPTYRTLSIDTSSGTGTLDLNGNLLTSNSILFTGANNYTISNGTMTGAQSTTSVIYQYGTGLLTFSGTLNAASSLTKAGTGTLELTGVNTSTGTIVVSGGALRTALTGGGLSGSHVLQLTGGVLESNGVFNRALGSGAGAFNFGDNDGQSSGGGFAAFGGTLEVLLPGLAGGNFAWYTTGTNPSLASGTALMLNSATADSMVDFQNNINLGNNGHAARVIDVADNTNLTTDFARISGVISGAAGTNGLVNPLVKTGAGRLELTGSNTYVGGTYVNAGTLLVNNSTGSGTGTGSVTVEDGALLGGTGFLVPTGSGPAGPNGITIKSGGILAPGASIGTLTVDLAGTTAGITMLGDSVFQFELGTAGASVNSVGTSDLLALTGASVGDLSFSGNDINFLGTGETGWYKLFDTDLVSGTTWSNLTLSGQEITGGLEVTNLAGGLTGTLYVGDGAGFGEFNDIYLQVTVVPEPASMMLACMGAGLLIFRRSRGVRGTARVRS